MKILVTGSTGLVGRNLLPFLKDNGHEVIALTRSTIIDCLSDSSLRPYYPPPPSGFP